jgi:hypothetical protein
MLTSSLHLERLLHRHHRCVSSLLKETRKRRRQDEAEESEQSSHDFPRWNFPILHQGVRGLQLQGPGEENEKPQAQQKRRVSFSADGMEVHKLSRVQTPESIPTDWSRLMSRVLRNAFQLHGLAVSDEQIRTMCTGFLSKLCQKLQLCTGHFLSLNRFLKMEPAVLHALATPSSDRAEAMLETIERGLLCFAVGTPRADELRDLDFIPRGPRFTHSGMDGS